MQSSIFTTQNNPPIPLLHFLLNLLRLPPLPHLTLRPKIPAPQSESQRPATIYHVPQHYFIRSRWPPSPFSSKQRERNVHIHVRLVSPAFLFPGMGKITRCMDSTRYLDYPFDSYCVSLIFCFFLALTILTRTLFSAPMPYGHLHVVMLSHCTSPLPFSPRHLLSFFGVYLYQIHRYVELMIVKMYQLRGYDTLIQRFAWNLRDRPYRTRSSCMKP